MKRLAVAAMVVLAAGAAQAQDFDVAAGEKVFAKCKACHAVGPGAKNKVGPELNGLIGRPVASVEGSSSRAASGRAAAGACMSNRNRGVDAAISISSSVISTGMSSKRGVER